jgi:hypothetical protein
MAEYKNKKTKLMFGTTIATDIATAETAATLGFGCKITNSVPPKATRSETTDEAVYCDGNDSFVKKDTGEPEYSEGSVTGIADKGDTAFDATMAALDTGFWADSKLTHFMVHPDGVTKKWAIIKLLEASQEPEGSATDKVKFTIRYQVHTKMSTV